MVRRAFATLERLDPALPAGRRAAPRVPPMALVAVYRARNQETMRHLVDSLPSGSQVALWALDHPAPDLECHTVGRGSGTRFTLLNRCVSALEPRGGEWLVVSDDDVAFRRGGPADAAAIASAAGLDLSQPAHTRQSYRNHEHNLRRPLTVARRGSFVEIGPLFVLSPAGRELVLPFREDTGMGWGTEVEWAALETRGLRLGIVDAVLMEHLVRAGGSYATEAESAREQAFLRAHGMTVIDDLHRDSACWTIFRRPAGTCA
jgi:hypothetical protein